MTCSGELNITYIEPVLNGQYHVAGSSYIWAGSKHCCPVGLGEMGHLPANHGHNESDMDTRGCAEHAWRYCGQDPTSSMLRVSRGAAWQPSLVGGRRPSSKTQKQNSKIIMRWTNSILFFNFDWYKNLNACGNRKNLEMFWNWDHHETTLAQSVKPTRFTTRWKNTSHHWVRDAPPLVKRPVIETSNTWMQKIMRIISLFGAKVAVFVMESQQRGHVSAFLYMERQTNNSGLVSNMYMERQAKSRN